MIPELSTSVVTVTLIPDGIILSSEVPGTTPPTHVEPVFQSPLCAAVNVTSGPIEDVGWCMAGSFGGDGMFGSFGGDGMAGNLGGDGMGGSFGGTGRVNDPFEFVPVMFPVCSDAKLDEFVPVMFPVCADAKLEFAIVPASKIAITSRAGNFKFTFYACILRI